LSDRERDDRAEADLARFLSREPTPEAAVQFTDEYNRLFDRLEDPTLKSIAQRKLEGWASEEIARDLGTTRRTVDRKLRLIRALWQEETEA
jgi:DNA-directed RNA polymerase specialized sigma24 family protein